MAFCALVHAYDNNIIAYNHLDPNLTEKNLELAFALAEQNMGIHKMYFNQKKKKMFLFFFL